ncbi:MAG TPA: glycosyltransferase family 4 protein [Silvibacterium sp.]|nr:glycosyltransferase family 4 protein [Silvibacterium sp.]
MKVLLVHNRYQQKGGEDSVVESEKELLTARGLEVELLEANNDHIIGIRNKIKASAAVFYSADGVERVNAAIAAFRPDVVHVHNWFPTFSPAIFRACKKQRVAVVHTLHNYRLLCAKASLFRDGVPCEDCLGTTLRLPGIVHGCYRGSRAGSAAATAAMLAHWRMGTWRHAVDRFVALSEFARAKMIEGGLPVEKILVKPNSLAVDPGVRAGDGGYFAYVGRLTDEKGIPTLLDCWKRGADLPRLRIVGTGPMEEQVREAAASLKNVEWLGSRSGDEVLDIIGGARALICPSQWYEGMPRVVIESMAVATPVIASRLGTYVEMIDHGRSGMLFEACNADALRACVREFAARSDAAEMRQATRKQFDDRYSAEKNFQQLVAIYEEAVAACAKANSLQSGRLQAA